MHRYAFFADGVQVLSLQIYPPFRVRDAAQGPGGLRADFPATQVLRPYARYSAAPLMSMSGAESR